MQNNSIGVFLALVLISTSAAEAAPLHERKSGKREIRVLPKSPALAPTTKRSAEKPKAPKLSADDLLQIQSKVKGLNNAKIQQYLLLIAGTAPQAAAMPDYMFRLAELYAQKQRYWRFRAMELYPKIDKANAAKKKKLQTKQRLYFKAEAQALKKSLAVYSKLAGESRYQGYSRMDEVLFFLGHTLDGVKRIPESRKIFHQLIKDYPSSKYIPQAYLAFADYFFEKGDLDNADRFYDKVLKFPKVRIYPYALYKKGWVSLNRERPQDALEIFFKVANLTANKKKSSTINKAAKKDFVRAYAEVGRAERAWQAFQRVDRSYAFQMLQVLGGIYLDQGKAAKAIHTFRQLISLKSKAPAVCEWQRSVVNAMLTTGSQPQKAEEIVNLVKVYQAHKKAKILKGSALAECRDSAQSIAGEMARVWHSEAMTTHNPESLGTVATLYGHYLQAFPKAQDHGEVHYYYADLLWLRAEHEKNPRRATQLWEKSATEFTKVVKSGSLRGAKLVDAAHAAAQGWKNALDVDPTTQPPETEIPGADTPIPTPEALGKREAKMLSAFDTYIQYASGDELVMMKFLRARVFWRRNRLKEALPFFYDIVKKHPEHAIALSASHILLDSLIRLKKYEAMNRRVLAMLGNKRLLSEQPSLVVRLRDLRTRYLRKKAEDLERKGMHVACGKAYYQIAEANQGEEGMDEVLYNAGTCFEDGKSIGLAIRMFETLGKRHPKSHLNRKALLRMGGAYGSVASYEKAAQKFELYSKRYGHQSDAPDALQNAVTYRKGIGMEREAIEDIEHFIKKYKKRNRQEAADALFGLAGIYENQGSPDKEAKAYKRYLGEIGKSGGLDRLLVANAKLGQLAWEASCKHSENDACVRTVRERASYRRGKRLRLKGQPTQCGPASKIKLTVLPRDSRRVTEAKKYFHRVITLAEQGAAGKAPTDGRKAAAIYWTAASRFHLAGERYEQFLALEFPRSLSFSQKNPKKSAESKQRFSAWLAKKTKLAEDLTSEYGRIKTIAGGGASWAVAAAARAGQVSQNFSDGLFTAEIPPEVRSGPYATEAVDAYCDTLTTAAAPLEDQSLQAFGFCLNLSTKLNWFNRWSRLCERELGQINPGKFPTATEMHGSPTATAAITDSQGLITTISKSGKQRSPI